MGQGPCRRRRWPAARRRGWRGRPPRSPPDRARRPAWREPWRVAPSVVADHRRDRVAGRERLLQRLVQLVFLVLALRVVRRGFRIRHASLLKLAQRPPYAPL